ncbi:MAG: hypothetical protein JWN40_1180 [Phycisphaerales bacterium]|nr:hypothetical protein [Phycisphaerales bacterium]
MSRFAVLWVLVAAGSFLFVTPARAQNTDSSALINQQLDKQAKLDLNGSLPDVMGQITKQTGVPIVAVPDVWAILPWGKETTVTAKIENQTLREALEVITRKLGLQFLLKDEAIELQPAPALRRLGRKSTISELDALNLLGATPLQLTTDKTDLKTLLEAVDSRLVAIKSPYAVENRTATSGNPVPQNIPIAVPRNASLLDALEAVTTQSPATWYPWGKTIVVLPKQEQVRRQLQKDITLRHDGTDVAQVLGELSMRSGVPFRYEPGTFQELAPQSRQIKLVLNATVMDALEAICGLTGLGYQVKDDEVYIWNTASTAVRPRDKTIAILQTETGLQVLINESNCPPDVREFIERVKEKQFDALRKMMAEQGFKPTNPATQPASRPTKAPPAPEPPGKDL